MRAKKEINIQIGARIKLAREKKGLTQEQFAEVIDKTPQFVSDLERGVSGISLETLRVLCMALNISSDSILFEGNENREIDIVVAKLGLMKADELTLMSEIVDCMLRLRNR